MYKLPGGAGWRLAVAAVAALLGVAALWLGYRQSRAFVPRDFEECAEEAQANASSNLERTELVAHCSERFAGRRKAGGGYTYYDFMQNRTFDIAGPNPTEDERRQIDRTYMLFLDAQQREAFSSDLAKRKADQEQAALERARQAPGPPLVLVPKIPLPVRRPLDRAKYAHCEDGSLSCSWARLSAAVKNAFASSSGAKP